MRIRRARRGETAPASLGAAGIIFVAVALALGIPGMSRSGHGGMRGPRPAKSRLVMTASGRVADGPLTFYAAPTDPDDEVDGDCEDDDDPDDRDAAATAGLAPPGLGAGRLTPKPRTGDSSPPGGAPGSRGPPGPVPAKTPTNPSSPCPASPSDDPAPPAPAAAPAGAALLIGGGRRRKALAGLLLTAVALPLSGCAKTTTIAAARKEPFQLEKVEGTERKRIRLAPKAAERLRIETAVVTAHPPSGEGAPRTAVPYGSVLYDTKGATSVYTVPEAFVYVRHPVTVAAFDGDTAVLAEGPSPGTVVVTAGSSELTGIEFGVGK